MEIELYSTTQFFAERENWSTQVHLDYFDISTLFVDYSDIMARETIVKMQTVITNPEEADKVNRFCKEFADRFHFSWVKSPALPGKDFINILSPEVSKGRALNELAAHLGISKEEIMAIGDGRNDVALLSAAGLAIAMQDAPAELKNIAHHVTLSVEESGVAAAVKKFLL
jgi:Cof subfamily protein (haloacid dehalogenase superfamily)